MVCYHYDDHKVPMDIAKKYLEPIGTFTEDKTCLLGDKIHTMGICLYEIINSMHVFDSENELETLFPNLKKHTSTTGDLGPIYDLENCDR
jgi:hypothetical protein